MIDYARITVTAGKGGDGGSSQQQLKGKRYSKADGGNGGSGGSVFLVATNDLNTLENYRFVKDYKAEDGKIGLGQLARGATGKDLLLKVPVGTVATFGSGGNETFPALFDLIEDGAQALVAKGGQGGRGNAHLRDEFGRRPRAGEKGQPGEVVEITLELKIIAQVGLIGLPNAGKSTLLSKLTAAKPAIAPYPFTTLEPNLGVLTSTVNREQTTANRQAPVVIADIPGLIEGASGGKGLGHLFLRHIERTTLIVHVIDANMEDPWKDYMTVRNELKTHSADLVKKKEIIVINKIDEVTPQRLEETLAVFKSHKKMTVPISAATGQNLEKLVKEIIKRT